MSIEIPMQHTTLMHMGDRPGDLARYAERD